MRFQLEEDILEGNSHAEIVAQMAKFKLNEVRSIQRYRKATAKRVKEMFGKDIDASSDEAFVTGLVEAGLLRKVR